MQNGEADDARNTHAKYYAGREAEVLALWDSPRQREAYEWLARMQARPSMQNTDVFKQPAQAA